MILAALLAVLLLQPYPNDLDDLDPCWVEEVVIIIEDPMYQQIDREFQQMEQALDEMEMLLDDAAEDLEDEDG